MRSPGCARPPRSAVPTRRRALASAIEFILEGLHLSNKLNKSESEEGGRRYQGA